ncbi:nucleotide exchange factor GrpE [Microbacterium sp. YY-01]|uniref:nucleotide exchange factor GrpE n=1 Tax=Microbacterium sp. YY-01 TaxID=3421634 RepID=UPI003D1860E8
MGDKNFDEPLGDDQQPDVGASGEGSEAQAPGPAPDPASGAADAEAGNDELTVEDILAAAEKGEAEGDDAALVDAENALLYDLKRLQAEYANYRRRTEEQRGIEIERAKGEAAKGLLPVLDDLARADQHGDLVEGSAFAVIAEKVRNLVEKLGVVAYGAAGEDFDPQHHEAIFQQPTPGAEKATIIEVVEVGYRLGTVELRPAKVVVAVPAD